MAGIFHLKEKAKQVAVGCRRILVVLRFRCDSEPEYDAASIGELHGISEKVVENLPELLFISPNPPRYGPHPDDFQEESLLSGKYPEHPFQVVQQPVKIAASGIYRCPRGLNFGHFKDIV